MRMTVVSTAPETLSASPLAWESITGKPRSVWRWVSGLAVSLLAAVLVVDHVHVGYYEIAPGAAEPVEQFITPRVGGRPSIVLTTVTLRTRITVLDLIRDWFDPNVDLGKVRDVTGGVSLQQFAAQNAQQMTDSQLFAEVAGLRRMGYKVPARPDGALIAAIVPRGPSDGRLQPGDVITAIDGAPVTTGAQASAAIRAHRPGALARVRFRRIGQSLDLLARIALGTCASDECGAERRGGAFLGVGLADDLHFDLPARPVVRITTQDIGGPSAGLAFALGVIEGLVGHRITGPHCVGVTGTIDADGRVGAVGGITQKTVAIERRHCDVLLVPVEEFVDAVVKAHGHHIAVVPVATLDQSLEALRGLGGDLSGVPPSARAAGSR